MPVRFKAFLLHLTGSAIIALLALLLVFRLWYPAPLHEALGVTDIFLLVLLVDVVLGPLLTLLVYQVGKKTLLLDLAVIACLQLAALTYGLWTVAEGRPAWLVFNVDRFDLVQVVDIDTRQLHEARPEYRNAPWSGPLYAAAANPESVEQRNTLLFESLMGGSDIPQRPNLYRPLAEMADSLRSKAQPLAELSRYNATQRVHETLADWPDANAWLPLMARAKPMVVLLRKESAEVVAIVELNPWD
ncbi:MAG: type IV pilin accessory protein [Pseudomonas sp.]|nr:type IV pilin accessory protein [Pseudomonas sp.]